MSDLRKLTCQHTVGPMSLPASLPALSHDDLVKLVLAQRHQIVELLAKVAALQAEGARLKREGQGPAAPFAKGTRVSTPQKPGRKPGKGLFRYRAAPERAPLPGACLEVPVTLRACPACGGQLVAEGEEGASLTEVPEAVRPHVRQFRVGGSRGRACGQRVRGQHPELAPDQDGVRAHRVGERVMASAHARHSGIGVPRRKGPAVLRELRGVRVTQSALTQDARRRAEGSVGAMSAQLRARVPKAEGVHTDDTGGRVGGEPAHLRAFETAAATVYQIRMRHRNEEVREVVPAAYAGVRVTDRGRSDDAIELAGVRQQKGLAHLQGTLGEVRERQHGKARAFGLRLKGLFRQARDLGHAYQPGKRSGVATHAPHLQAALPHQLRDRPLKDPDNRRLLNELGGPHDRGNLLRFLDNPRSEPTNNWAERALRAAVIARKVSQCSQNARGAQTFAAFPSVVRTLARTGADSLAEGLLHVFPSAQMPDASPEACHQSR
jgi:transposase